jgi:hypothetical protein
MSDTGIRAGEELTCDYRIGDVAPFYGVNGASPHE